MAVFRFLEYGLSIELRSIIRPEGLTLRASAKALFNAAQAPVVRVRAPYSEEPAYGGFSLSGVRTLHRTAFDYSAKGLTLRASAEALFNAAQAPVVRVRSPYSEEPAYGGFFAFWSTDSSSNCVRLFGPKASPCGPALKRCSTRRRRRLSESGRPIQNNPPMAGFSLSRVRTLHRTAFDYSARRPHPAGQR